MTRLIAAVAVPLTTLLPAVVPGWDQAAAASRALTDSARVALGTPPGRAADIAKIIAVLQHGTAAPALGAKASDKLATLSDRQLRLMAALSERAAAHVDGAAGGIALLLITALLILS
jgi:hypothetical protein